MPPGTEIIRGLPVIPGGDTRSAREWASCADSNSIRYGFGSREQTGDRIFQRLA